MHRARRVKKSAQNRLEIHLHVPRLAKPSPKVKQKLMLPFHAEVKGLGGRWCTSKRRRSIFRFVFGML